MLFFCVEDKIQGDLGLGEMGLSNLLGLATHCGGGFGSLSLQPHSAVLERRFPTRGTHTSEGFLLQLPGGIH